MALLYRILYAAHASGTHHKLALRALQRLPDLGGRSETWRRLFLAHVNRYLSGSKAPDKVFKDFQNHVLHAAASPGDAEWGGAPRLTETWYRNLVAALRIRDWGEAAHAAGVMGHYYADVLMPLHTGSSEREGAVHRAAEWSVSKSFERLWAMAEPEPVAQPPGNDWIRVMVSEGAARARADYELLIDEYDLVLGSKAPEEGFSAKAEAAIAPLLGHAASGVATLMGAAIEESAAAPQEVSLTAATVVAGLEIPVKWVEKRLENAEDRRVVAAMAEEFERTGRVEESLPEEQRVVRALATLHRADRPALAYRPSAPIEIAREPANDDAPELAPELAPEPAPERRVSLVVEEPAPRPAKQADAPTDAPVAAKPRVRRPAVAVRPGAPEPPAEAPKRAAPSFRPPALSYHEPVERAPSIGPKTAARLESIGVATIGDLLEHDGETIAALLDVRWIKPELVEIWRDQARLLTETPALRAVEAMLLVGAGYRDRAALAAADAERLVDELAEIAASPAMQRALRDPKAPNPRRAALLVAAAARSVADEADAPTESAERAKGARSV